MRLEDFKLWVTGLSRHQVARVIGLATRSIVRPRRPSRVRPGEFICDRHWQQIASTFDGPDPISPTSVTVGLTIACHLAGMPEGTPVRHACCKLNARGWRGILERSRSSWTEGARKTA